MQNESKSSTGRRIVGFGAAAILAIFGLASIVQGLDGRDTVATALQQEKVVGTPQMTPGGIATKVKEAGVQGLTLPTCSVAGKAITDGPSARCFAEYMRVDAMIATGGKTYAQMPRFATDDGKGTNIEAQASVGPDGRPVNNPARNIWVTETALTTALNTSYMASQISLFGIAVGAAFVLLGLLLAASSAVGLKVPARARAGKREPALEPAAA